MIRRKTLFFSRKLIYLTLWSFDSIAGRKANLVILCYHSISENGKRFSTPIKEFKSQIEYLQNNYEAISVKELEEYLSGKRNINMPSYLLTFDDGYRNILRVKTYLKSRGIKPLVFVLSNTKEVVRREVDTMEEFLNNKEIKELRRAGWGIGCHSATHANLKTLDSGSLIKEIIDSKRNLERNLKFSINYFSFPKGIYSDEIIKFVKKASYKLAFLVHGGLVSTHTYTYKIPRIGIDGSHSGIEFKAAISPSNIQLRNLILKFLP